MARAIALSRGVSLEDPVRDLQERSRYRRIDVGLDDGDAAVAVRADLRIERDLAEKRRRCLRG